MHDRRYATHLNMHASLTTCPSSNQSSHFLIYRTSPRQRLAVGLVYRSSTQVDHALFFLGQEQVIPIRSGWFFHGLLSNCSLHKPYITSGRGRESMVIPDLWLSGTGKEYNQVVIGDTVRIWFLIDLVSYCGVQVQCNPFKLKGKACTNWTCDGKTVVVEEESRIGYRFVSDRTI